MFLNCFTVSNVLFSMLHFSPLFYILLRVKWHFWSLLSKYVLSVNCQMIWRVWFDYWAVDQKNLTFLVLIPCQVNPQFYAFRWIILLLTQEFNFADILHIWDVILSDPEGPQVQFCSYLSCTTLNFSLKKKKLMDWHLTLCSTTT